MRKNIHKIGCAWSCDKEPGQAPTQRICQLSIGPFAYGGRWMGLYLGCHDSGCGLIILSTGRADPRPQHVMPSSSRVLAKAGHTSSKTDRKPSWIFNAARASSPPCWSKIFLSLDHFNFGPVQSTLVGPSAPISNAMTGAVLNFMSNSNGACESSTFCKVQKAPIYALNVVLNYHMLEE